MSARFGGFDETDGSRAEGLTTDKEIVLAVIAVLPQLLLVVVLVALAVAFRAPLARMIDQRVASLSAFGFRVDLRPTEVDAAVQARAAMIGASAGLLTNTGERVAQRAQRLAPHIGGRTVLWVDDHPESTRTERRLARHMGLFAEVVTNNREALELLNHPGEKIDLVVTDIKRDDGSPDGLALAQAIQAVDNRPSVICYVTRISQDRGSPPGAFGITNRPDELLHLIMDALDRQPAPGHRA